MTQEMQIAIGLPAFILAEWLWIWIGIKYEDKTGNSFDDLIWTVTLVAFVACCLLALAGTWIYCCGKTFMQLFGIT